MGELILQLGFSGAREPLYVIGNLKEGVLQNQYRFSEKKSPTVENVLKWADEVVNKSLRAHIRSEPIVRDQTGPVFKLVGLDFAKTVNNETFDAVVAILSGPPEEWERTLVTMNEAAGEFASQGVKTVRFFSVDSTLNDLPGLAIDDWKSPVIVLWPIDSKKKAILFRGDIHPLELMQQIRVHAGSQPKLALIGDSDEDSSL
jgi:hypothetical protein